MDRGDCNSPPRVSAYLTTHATPALKEREAGGGRLVSLRGRRGERQAEVEREAGGGRERGRRRQACVAARAFVS
jgi:hypothetical protein